MAKKGKRERQLTKQINQLKKFQKRAKQRGQQITSDVPTTSSTPTSEDIQTVRQAKLSVKNNRPAKPKTFKLSPSTLKQAILSRREQMSKPRPKPIPKKPKPIIPTAKQLSEAIKGRKKARPNTKPKQTKEDKLREQLNNLYKQMDVLTKPRKMTKEERAVNNKKLDELDKQIAKTIKELPKSKPKDDTNSTRKMMEELKKNEAKWNEERRAKQDNLKSEHPDKISNDTALFTNTIINNYLEDVNNYPNSAGPKLTNLINRMVNEHGADTVARVLQEHAESGNLLTFEIAYDSSKMAGYVSSMLDLFDDMTDWYKDELLEEFSYGADDFEY